MYKPEQTPVEEPVYEQLGRGSGYELTEEQKAALPDTAKVALSILSDDMNRFFNASDITATHMEVTKLDREALVTANKELRREGYAILEVPLGDAITIKQVLTEDGRAFLEAEIAKVTN